MDGGDLIGREDERAWLREAVADAVAGRGALVLLTGEAGVGKTRLAEAVAEESGVRLLRGVAGTASPPYCPVVVALRRFVQSEPGGLGDCGPLRPHLALLMPELGPGAGATDQATLFEAIRCALGSVVDAEPAILLLDDLQWSDDATLELLGWLASALAGAPLLVVAAYRSDETPSGHPVRRLRTNLRRDRLLRELTVEPLGAAQTKALAERVLGEPLAASLAATLHHRTQGNPFFVEELAEALRARGHLDRDPSGLALRSDGDVLVPETVRDAVLLRAATLSEQARGAANAAAVFGAEFELDVVSDLSGDGLAGLLSSGLVVERRGGRAAFRHRLVRDALYEDVPWLERRELHRRIAEALDGLPHAAAAIAAHRQAAGDTALALEAYVRAVDEQTALHAHRDAVRLARQALDLWPADERPADRVTLLERYAHSCELMGWFTESARALREAVAVRQATASDRALADAQRRLAGVYALQGDRERALAARQVAAAAYAAHGLTADAAAERLVAATFLQSRGRHAEAAETARQAGEEARLAERTDLRARALGLAGVAQAKGGDFAGGVETVRAGLALALEHELTAEAAEVYQRLATALETAADYRGAEGALNTAVALCRTGDAGDLEQACLSCMAYVLRELGEWDRAAELSADIIAAGGDTLVADGILGAIHAFRGDLRAARPLLQRSLDASSRLEVVSMQVDTNAALAMVEERDGDGVAAAEHCRALLARWQRSEDRHYAVWGLRWAACLLAGQGDVGGARACAEGLSEIASATGHADALAALAHALGELALREGDADAAADQIERAVELHAGIDIPFERAHVQLRAGVALAAAGRREPALDRLAGAYRLARKLGATPIASDAAAEVERLGESVEVRLGRRAAADRDGAGLSRRELQVMRLVAVGRTNREIAAELFLSPRTVDMHVRNILAKLDCRSRVEAVARAGELQLLA